MTITAQHYAGWCQPQVGNVVRILRGAGSGTDGIVEGVRVISGVRRLTVTVGCVAYVVDEHDAENRDCHSPHHRSLLGVRP